MKRFLTLLALLVLTLMTLSLRAADQLPLESVAADKLTSELQSSANGKNGMNLVWWIPTEFWSATLLSNKDLPPEASKEVIDKLKPYAFLAVVRGDITDAKFYDKATVEANLTVTYKDATGKALILKPIANPNDTVTQLINQIKPMLTAAMGKAGQNMHFYVFDDLAAGQRVVPLTEHGQLLVELKPLPKEDGGTIAFDLPLDSLFKPRLCANCGHKANVAWLFCPFCGKELAK